MTVEFPVYSEERSPTHRPPQTPPSSVFSPEFLLVSAEFSEREERKK